MRIEGANGTQTGMWESMPQGMDSVSKSIRSQIRQKQEELQELNENEKLSAEEKMKKRQAIRKEIADLNSQLRRHQIEQRRAQQRALTAEQEGFGSNN